MTGLRLQCAGGSNLGQFIQEIDVLAMLDLHLDIHAMADLMPPGLQDMPA